MTTRSCAQSHRLVRCTTVLVVVVVMFLGTVLASYLTRSTGSQQVRYGGDFQHVEVSVSGMASVRAAAVSQVQAEWTLAWSLRRPEVRRTTDDGTLRLSVSCPTAPGRDCSSSVSLAVPPDVSVSVSGDGGVRARGLRAGIDASSDSGRIKISDVDGPVRLHTREGTVNANGLTGDDVRVHTRDGAVSLTHATPPRNVHITTRDGDVELGLPSVDGGYALRIDGHDGSERVSVPDNPHSARQVTVRGHDAGIRVGPAT